MKSSTKLLKALALVLAMMMLLAGCATSTNGNLGKEPEIGEPKYGDTYPIESDTVLTIWTNKKPDAAYLTHEETPVHQEFTKRTGIKTEWQFPSGDAGEAFNLMIASGSYPDVIVHTWLGGAYSPADAIREGVIYPIDKIVDAYAPVYKSYLDADPERVKYLKTEDGQLFGFSGISGRDTAPFIGPMVRGDLLEKLNIKEPETIDDWTAMLRAFKENGIESPLTYEGRLMTDARYSPFIFGAFNTACGYYINDEGKVEYGPMTDKFKDALTLMRDWFAEGLLDKEFVSIEDTITYQKLLDGRSAVTHYFLSAVKGLNDSSRESGSGYTFKALPYPTATRGQKAEFGHMPEAYSVSGIYDFAAISTHCKDVELAAKFLDYAYTEEGSMLCNFGIEGVTYTMESGNLDLLEPYKSDFSLLTPYFRQWCTIGDERFADLRYTDPAQAGARELWKTNMNAHVLPSITPSQEEADELNELLTNIDDYVNEQVLKFITGSASLEDYDAFKTELSRLGVERVVEIKQNQLDRFNNR